MDTETRLIIYTDGGSRGNPGPAAWGVYIENQHGKMLWEKGEYIGTTTNNVAEYSAVINALKWIIHFQKSTPVTAISFFLDSQLVVRQLGGMYKIKSIGLLPLFDEIRNLEREVHTPISYTHIPREKNKKADRQVNVALDNLK